jgi:hypothetical protein
LAATTTPAGPDFVLEAIYLTSLSYREIRPATKRVHHG